MSERGSFTTEYIYNTDDYQTIREALDWKSKYLCISPPATWSHDDMTEIMPIVSGKVGELDPGLEWVTIANALEGVKTKATIRVVVMTDAGAIQLVTKYYDGHVDVEEIYDNYKEE